MSSMIEKLNKQCLTIGQLEMKRAILEALTAAGLQQAVVVAVNVPVKELQP